MAVLLLTSSQPLSFANGMIKLARKKTWTERWGMSLCEDGWLETYCRLSTFSSLFILWIPVSILGIHHRMNYEWSNEIKILKSLKLILGRFFSSVDSNFPRHINERNIYLFAFIMHRNVFRYLHKPWNYENLLLLLCKCVFKILSLNASVVLLPSIVFHKKISLETFTYHLC